MTCMPQKLFIEALAMALLGILFAIYISRIEGGLWWDGLGWDGMGWDGRRIKSRT